MGSKHYNSSYFYKYRINLGYFHSRTLLSQHFAFFIFIHLCSYIIKDIYFCTGSYMVYVVYASTSLYYFFVPQSLVTSIGEVLCCVPKETFAFCGLENSNLNNTSHHWQNFRTLAFLNFLFLKLDRKLIFIVRIVTKNIQEISPELPGLLSVSNFDAGRLALDKSFLQQMVSFKKNNLPLLIFIFIRRAG